MDLRDVHLSILYVKEGKKGNLLIIVLYVDDLIFTVNNIHDIEEFKRSMMREFKITDLGLLHFFLGIEVKQNGEGIFINQEKYARELIRSSEWKKESPSPLQLKLI